MGLARSALLAASTSVWLRRRATRSSLMRRAVTRFMPGERLDDALVAARNLRGEGMTCVVTCLGENVTTGEEAARVADHYLEVLDRVQREALDVEISLKLTHLGLDIDNDVAAGHLVRLAVKAAETASRVWIDMEDSSNTDRTIDLYRRLLPAHPAMGLCLQAYLRRTGSDLETLMPLGGAIRLVKGAYREPKSVAYPSKRDVDESFFHLASRLLGPGARSAGCLAVFGTHDAALIRRIVEAAAARGVPPSAFEFDLLYGIRRDVQERLAREGFRVRVLVSYGSFWFPWYMRRLAERPANLWFVLRSVLAG